MQEYTVEIVVKVKQVKVEATSQAEANQIVLDDVKTRFNCCVTVSTHTCS